MNFIWKQLLIATVLYFCCTDAYAQQITIVDSQLSIVGKNSYYLEDKGNSLLINEVVDSKSFKPCEQKVMNFGLSQSSFWIKFTLLNKTKYDVLALNIEQPALSHAELFFTDTNNKITSIKTGIDFPFYHRTEIVPSIAFQLPIPHNQSRTFYLKIKGNTSLVIPTFVGSNKYIYKNIRQKNLLFGIYAGIIICMLLYNLFLLFSVRDDRSYIWYVLHTLFVGLTQASFFGYAFQYLWPNNTWLANQSIFIFTCLVSIFGIIFMQVFLQLKTALPRVNKGFRIFFGLYILVLFFSFTNHFDIAYQILQPTQGFVAIFILIISIYMVRHGYKQARFYLLSWFLLMIGIIIFALKDFNVIPYNLFTSTIMLSGSGVQVILLSFALGDKINILQDQTIKATEANARIIAEQNVVLEARVEERTSELKTSNDELNKAMKDLKDAEIHLVESEKMASLGQLTAGIAHEINNPINFVTSNVKPLGRDIHALLETIDTLETIHAKDIPDAEKQKQIEDYKTDIDFDYLKVEIDHLLSGISDGAHRTAEIVKGLRVFSRLDEDDLKKANINDGLDSTLILVNNLLNNNIQVKKHYETDLQIDCYPGKLNQIFMNIISNGIYAINKKFNGNQGGALTITTSNDEQKFYIRLADNGIGMEEVTRKKIFDPFFTTKDVGEGTGLGLSIVYNTINKHNGTIDVNSVVGEGTEFLITLPILQ